ncbi:MAG: phosphoserine phosphatase SerB [Deltaproteobacteria bacterium CG11_big_fil_rev_8_21_14_0_20_47_16]|nr:MAG: phosphoserine phosphatase SerB [Deltaproteobacteria bacterium CG11_big_fil_rev_8_21_14_0_20_47_16]
MVAQSRRSKSKSDVILVTVRGPDGPGITARLTGIIAEDKGAVLLDIEQSIVHKKLFLSLLLRFEKGPNNSRNLLKELLFAAKDMNMDLAFEVFDSKLLGESAPLHQYAITCVGTQLGAYPLHRIAQALARKGMNIDKIGKLTMHTLSSVEIVAHSPRQLDPKKVSQDLLQLSSELQVDIAIQRYDLLRRAKRMIVFDMDSTLIAHEVIDELAREAGAMKKVSAITEKAMNGELDFAESLKARVRCLKGLPESALNKVCKRLKLTPGAERLLTVLRQLGFKTAVVSGGFTYFTERLKDHLSLDYAFANQLEIRNGKLTGNVQGEIIDAHRKAFILQTLAQGEGISLDQVIAVGDGANDLPMLSKAGLGIAFHAKEVVRRKASYAIHQAGLDAILYLLGISEKELRHLKI